MDASLDALLQQGLATLDRGHLRRHLRPFQYQQGQMHDGAGRALIDAASNDYLGLSQHPLVKARAAAWAERHGAGAGASRLITGTRDITVEVEDKLAAFKQCEAALLFSSGFQANATVIPALAEVGAAETELFSDELNHASIVHGCRAARGQARIFRHNDLTHLEELLRRSSAARKLIITESVFSMDGDRADLPALVQLAESHGAALYVDEAHASGVLGPQGRGLAAAAECHGGVDVVMGTLGKAFGAFGAYIAGSRSLIDYLVNRCRGLIYSTALPPPVLGAIDAALDLVPGMDADRARLEQSSEHLRDVLARLGYDTLGSTTQIIPVVIGSEDQALAAARRLESAGLLTVAIRPPTVPRGTSRLRLTLSSSLDEVDTQRLLDAVASCLPPRSPAQ